MFNLLYSQPQKNTLRWQLGLSILVLIALGFGVYLLQQETVTQQAVAVSIEAIQQEELHQSAQEEEIYFEAAQATHLISEESLTVSHTKIENYCETNPLGGVIQAVFLHETRQIVHYIDEAGKKNLLQKGDFLIENQQLWQLEQVQSSKIVWRHKNEGCRLEQPF